MEDLKVDKYDGCAINEMRKAGGMPLVDAERLYELSNSEIKQKTAMWLKMLSHNAYCDPDNRI